jgi:anti-sigma regulatory factor (Ser/Thr protein kinase)
VQYDDAFPPSPGSPPARARFAPDPTGVRRARQFVAEQCAEAGLCEDAREAAVLLTSELVTNAFVHGRSEARLAVYLGRDSARVEVADDSARTPEVQENDHHSLDGRGLQILHLGADRWGVRPEGPGKVVWFDVVCRAHRPTS